MGVVYRAHDEVLHRDVAVKVVKKDAGLGPSASQHLLHEARASSSLSHSPATLADALSALWTIYPGVREHINIFIGDENS